MAYFKELSVKILFTYFPKAIDGEVIVKEKQLNAKPFTKAIKDKNL